MGAIVTVLLNTIIDLTVITESKLPSAKTYPSANGKKTTENAGFSCKSLFRINLLLSQVTICYKRDWNGKLFFKYSSSCNSLCTVLHIISNNLMCYRVILSPLFIITFTIFISAIISNNIISLGK